MHFGEEVSEERLISLWRPGDGIDTVITADVYGCGAADTLLSKALEGAKRDQFCLIGAIGHDFYKGKRAGAKGYPRFTDPHLRESSDYGDYIRMATERSLERCGVSEFDVLLLHNPDLTGYRSEVVWEGLRAVRDQGLARHIGVAPGPANGFTLDLIDCFEHFGELIDWAMIILNPFEPWPGELVLEAAQKYSVNLITRVVDYGGLFWDDVVDGSFTTGDHRSFRPQGWVQSGLQRLDSIRCVAERSGLSAIGLAAQWNLSQPPVKCVVPTLIQEAGPAAKSIEAKRRELAAIPVSPILSQEDVSFIRSIGDNTQTMKLKGAHPSFKGPQEPDRWPIDQRLRDLAARWGIEITAESYRSLDPSFV